LKWHELKDKDLVLLSGAVSGGLDSCTVTHWLNSNGFNVHCYTVDLGQPDETSLEHVADRMVKCGAQKASVVIGSQKLAEAGLTVIQSQARYEGGYWNTTGIARPITVSAILPELESQQSKVLFHGATGRGNDQVRFQVASNILDPSIIVYAPWRDPGFVQQFPGRQQMLDYCASNNLPIKPASESRYSTDSNLLGLTHEAGDLEDLTISPDFVNPGMGVWPWDAPEQKEVVVVKWEEGEPVEINGVQLDLVGIFERSNQIAGRHGVGIGTHVVENRYVGTKSRGIYESPGMELLGRSYEYLLQLIMDRRAREIFETLSSIISVQIYQGYWLDLATSVALAGLRPITKLVSGTVNIVLYKGEIYFDSVDESTQKINHSLYTDDSSMEALGNYDHADAEGFLKILGVSAKNFGERQFPSIDR
tara:strand:- start:27622 stop:28884 length:1263 start_codon:yes stop_codon:yes gene_type:complete